VQMLATSVSHCLLAVDLAVATLHIKHKTSYSLHSYSYGLSLCSLHHSSTQLRHLAAQGMKPMLDVGAA